MKLKASWSITPADLNELETPHGDRMYRMKIKEGELYELWLDDCQRPAVAIKKVMIDNKLYARRTVVWQMLTGDEMVYLSEKRIFKIGTATSPFSEYDKHVVKTIKKMARMEDKRVLKVMLDDDKKTKRMKHDE